MDCLPDCPRLIAFASVVQVLSCGRVTSQVYKLICLAYTSDDSCIHYTMHSISIDGAPDFYRRDCMAGLSRPLHCLRI